MKLHTLNRITLSVTLLAVGAFSPNLRADGWSSLRGNNRSASVPSTTPRSQPQANRQSQPNRQQQPVAHAPAQIAAPHQQPQAREQQPMVRTPEPRQEVQPVREQPHEVTRGPERPAAVEHERDQHEMVAGARAEEVDRRRMDIDEDRRQSFFWADFHAGMHIDRLPDGFRRIGVRGHPFFYFEGVYYDQGAAGYVIVAPPLGAVVSELPPGAETVVLGDTVYYYAGGAFYVQQPDGSFVVVAPPIGVTVTMLPPDAISVLINGIVHYQADSAYYLPVMQNGVTAYLTVHLP